MRNPRRMFDLREEDQEYLEELKLPFETVREDGTMWLIVHRYPVPSGYNKKVVSAALQVPSSYPDSQIDMVYFYPELSLKSGRDIRQLTNHRIDGKPWQRWSRHRTAANPWRMGIDNIETHFLLVGEWLTRELGKVA